MQRIAGLDYSTMRNKTGPPAEAKEPGIERILPRQSQSPEASSELLGIQLNPCSASLHNNSPKLCKQQHHKKRNGGSSMASNPTEMLLDKLDNVKQISENEWQATCPAHDDRNPSLSIGTGNDGRVLVTCHAGCDTEDVVSTVGLSMRDLFPVDSCHEQLSTVENPSPEPRKRCAGSSGSISATYNYMDESGILLYQVVRYDPKDFRQRQPDGNGGWIWNMRGISRVLYRLPDIVSASPEEWIFITEGEKDADALHGIGLIATTNSGGAGKWGSISDTSVLKDRKVAIIPDCDEPGYSHAQDVARQLKGVADDVRIIDLRVIKELEGKDVSDWLDWLDCREPEELRDTMLDMAEEASPYTGHNWPQLIPLKKDMGTPPEFPCEAFPPWLRDMIEEVAESTQTPPDLAGSVCLGILSLSVAGKILVNPYSDWKEPLNLFLAVSLPSACRKSAVYRMMKDPLAKWECTESDVINSKAQEMKIELDIDKGRLGGLKADAINGDDLARIEALELGMKIAKTSIPRSPRLYTSDATPEAVAALLGDHDGRLGVLSTEGGEFFEIITSRYSRGKSSHNMEIYLKGHAGDAIRVDRKSRLADPIIVNNPALSVVLFVQPDVLEKAWSDKTLENRGLLGRFLYSLPKNPLGERSVMPAPVSDKVKTRYETGIQDLLNLSKSLIEVEETHDLFLTEEAQTLILDFGSDLEPSLSDDGRYGHMTSWAGKCAGTIARIAGILHMANDPKDPEPWIIPISEDTMRAAIIIGKHFLIQAERAYGLFGDTPEVRLELRILRRIRDRELRCFSTREIYQPSGLDIGETKMALKLLQKHGYIKPVVEETKGPGRKSEKWEVNPIVFEDFDKFVDSVEGVKI